MKRLVCCLHGLMDRTLKDLNDQTPFECAQTPNLDTLLFQTENTGFSEPSHALWHLLTGESKVAARPVLEAYGLGCTLEPGQRAYSIRFISVVEDCVVDVADSLLSDEEGREFCRTLNQAVKGVRFVPLQGTQALLICNDSFSSHTYPIDWIGKKWEAPEPLACFTPLLDEHSINAFRLEELETYPVNTVSPCMGGEAEELKPHKIKLKTKIYSSHPSTHGIAKLVEADLWRLPSEHRRFAHIDLILRKWKKEMEGYEQLVLDLSYLWESTYKGALLEKVKTIEWLDRHFFGPLLIQIKEAGYEFVLHPLTHSDITQGRSIAGQVAVFRACTP